MRASSASGVASILASAATGVDKGSRRIAGLVVASLPLGRGPAALLLPPPQQQPGGEAAADGAVAAACTIAVAAAPAFAAEAASRIWAHSAVPDVRRGVVPWSPSIGPATGGGSTWGCSGGVGAGQRSSCQAATANPAIAAAMVYGLAGQVGNRHNAQPRASGSTLLAAASPGLMTYLPYEYGTASRCRRHSSSGCCRAAGLRWGLPAQQMWHGEMLTAAAAAPTLFAVRQLHGGRGGGGGDVDDGHGLAAGDSPRPSYRASPRDEGLGAPMDVFDRQLKALHRDRSAALLDSSDPLMAAVSERLLDRLEDCRRCFPTAVVLGGAALPVLHQLPAGRAGIERVVVVDSSQDMLDRVKREEAEARSRAAGGAGKPWPRVLCVRGDEEALPLRPHSVDLIISCLGLHWANDLPGAIAQCRMALVPDGLFLGALLGGDTLQELRIACALAQMEREGGVSAVVSPLAQVRDAGNLLTRADLRLPTVDVDRFRIGYPSALELVQHLRALGESNAALRRRRALSRDSALAAAAVYQSMFGSPEEGGGGVSATFEAIFMAGWAPAANQPKAAKRGSATVSFQELAEGLVKGGAGVGGTADDWIVMPPPPPPPPPPPSSRP